ncbi:MAG: hypothetical protein R2690_20020 [Acidimicrobiales bacterium]
MGNESRLDGTFDLVDGAVLRAALEHAMGRPDPVDRVGGQRTTPQRRADALVEICRFYGDVNDLDSDDSEDLDTADGFDLMPAASTATRQPAPTPTPAPNREPGPTASSGGGVERRGGRRRRGSRWGCGSISTC